MHPGMFAAALAYVIWGVFPLYFHHLADVPPLEMVLHRSVWSLVFVMGVLAWQRRWRWLLDVVKQPRVLATFAASTTFLSANWLLYVWAVQQGRVVEASLGYFINPLFNVLLGVLVLGERPRPFQWLAVAIAAAAGVTGAVSLSGGSGADPADFWAYELAPGVSAGQYVTEIHAMLTTLTGGSVVLPVNVKQVNDKIIYGNGIPGSDVFRVTP